MRLNKISLVNFKNYAEASLDFDEGVNCLVGNNGAGKTNILDAMYYLCFCKSYFNPSDGQNVSHDEKLFVIQGQFDRNGKKESVFCGFAKGKKKQFKRNKKEYSRLADHIGLFPCVMVSPYDQELITEGSELRRKLMDGIISQFDRSYLDNIITYSRALAQRNGLLKLFAEKRTFDAIALEVWNEQLIGLANLIYKERAAFIENFGPVFQRYFELISGGVEKVELEYKSQLHDASMDHLLESGLAQDRARQHTGFGIHKDDLVFTINSYPVKKFGSQGQQKTYLIALKLAQFDFIKEKTDQTPLLLLDDIFDKLDANRVEQLMQLVSNKTFGQIFITDTSKERIPDIFERLKLPYKQFTIENGDVVS